jgi:hypothetical protein
MNYTYDKLNSFGTLAVAGDFPNTINLGEASIERMAVDLKVPQGPFAGGPVTLTVKGADTETGAYETIVQSGPVTAGMIAEGYGLPVPKSSLPFIKVAIAGAFTGTVEAIINSYLGK